MGRIRDQGASSAHNAALSTGARTVPDGTVDLEGYAAVPHEFRWGRHVRSISLSTHKGSRRPALCARRAILSPADRRPECDVYWGSCLVSAGSGAHRHTGGGLLVAGTGHRAPPIVGEAPGMVGPRTGSWTAPDHPSRHECWPGLPLTWRALFRLRGAGRGFGSVAVAAGCVCMRSEAVDQCVGGVCEEVAFERGEGHDAVDVGLHLQVAGHSTVPVVLDPQLMGPDVRIVQGPQEPDPLARFENFHCPSPLSLECPPKIIALSNKI